MTAPRQTAARPVRVTISIVSHGHGADVARLLASLDAHLDPEGADVRIVLTENLPERAGNAVSSRFDVQRIVNSVPMGFGANHNQAFRAGESDWFLVLNPDIWLDAPLRLGRLRDQSGPDCLFSATVLTSGGAIADFQRPFVTPVALARRIARRPAQEACPTWFAAIFLAIPAPAYAALGGFDEGYFMYVEDCDLGWRARRNGLSLQVEPRWRVRHHAYRASRRSFRHFFWHMTSLVRFWRKYMALEWQRSGTRRTLDKGAP